MINDDIMVCLLKTKDPEQIEIGISAPKSAVIRRDKLVEKELTEYMQLNLNTASPKRILQTFDLLREKDAVLKGVATGVSKKAAIRRLRESEQVKSGKGDMRRHNNNKQTVEMKQIAHGRKEIEQPEELAAASSG